MTRSTPPDRLRALLAIPLLALSLAACSSPPTPQESGPAGETRTGDQETSAEQWQLDFAECMRSHGIDMEDPNADGGIVATRPQDETPERQAATTACMDELGPAPANSGNGSSGGVPQDQLELAGCLREHGLDVEDPEPGSGIGMPEGITDEIVEACSADVTGGVPAQ